MLIYRTNPAARGERRPYVPPMDFDDLPTIFARPAPRKRAERSHRSPYAIIGTARPAHDLLARIARLAFLHNLSDAAIGRAALGDPNAVYQLRKGRRIRDVTRARIVHYLDKLEGC